MNNFSSKESIMLSPGTVVDVADAELSNLNTTRLTLSGLTGITNGTLCAILNGAVSPSFEQRQLIYDWIVKLREFVKVCRPIPVDTKKVSVLRDLILAFEAGILHISVHKEEPIAAPEPQFHVFMGNQYFVCRSANPLGKIVISGSFQSSGAARVTKECGDKLVAALAAEGHRAQLVKSTSTSEDGANNNFAALWGEAQQVRQ
jgi:hypothetical protein